MPRPGPVRRAHGARYAGRSADPDRRLAQQRLRIGFGIGLAKGPATVGRIGYEGRYDYTAIGSIVNLASRICAAAEDGQTLIDQAAAAEIGDALVLTPLGTRPLRGFAEAVPVFSVAERPPVAAALQLAE